MPSRQSHSRTDTFGRNDTDGEQRSSSCRLIVEIGNPVVEDPAQGLSPDELAACVARTLALPEIVELRPNLAPEFPVYAAALVEDVEQAAAGIADAMCFGLNGEPRVVIDWKSDVQQRPEVVEDYRAQVRKYLDMTGTPRGLIVFVTSGETLLVTPTPAAAVGA